MRFCIFLSAALLTSCYSAPEIEGFDKKEWNQEINNCNQSKVKLAEILLNNEEKLLGMGQASIKSFLGQPYANELYQRNQKFFYYQLTPGDTCSTIQTPLMLSIRFDAIDLSLIHI